MKIKYRDAKAMIESGQYEIYATRNSSMFGPRYYLRALNSFPVVVFAVRDDAGQKLFQEAR